MKALGASLVVALVGIAIGVGGTLLIQHVRSPAAVVSAPDTSRAVDVRPAIDALRALRSITEAATTYQNYSAKTGETKVEVDRYLRAAPIDDRRREPVELAMTYYVAASLAWSAKSSDGRENVSRLAPRLGSDRRLSACPIIKSIRENAEIRKVALLALNIAPFWECASAKVAEAERLA